MLSLFTHFRISWIFSLTSPHLGQTSLSFFARTWTSILPSPRMHWLTISNSGRSRGTMTPCFGSHSLLSCSSLVCFCGIACPLFDWDFCFLPHQTKDKLIPSFLTLPLLSPGRTESRTGWRFTRVQAESQAQQGYAAEGSQAPQGYAAEGSQAPQQGYAAEGSQAPQGYEEYSGKANRPAYDPVRDIWDREE